MLSSGLRKNLKRWQRYKDKAKNFQKIILTVMHPYSIILASFASMKCHFIWACTFRAIVRTNKTGVAALIG